MANARNLSKLGNGPAFSASPSSTQALTSNTPTKINCATEEYDVGGFYNASTSRFQPTTAGYYLLTGGIQMDGNTNLFVSFYKNGTLYRFGGYQAAVGLSPCANLSVIMYLNGSTDFVEMWANSSTSISTSSSFPTSVYFQGCLIKG